jgi:hypothetical protein
MNTIWSDDVQMLKRPSWPGIAYGGAAAWQEKPVDREHFFSNDAALEYLPGPAPHISLALQELADSESSLQEVLGQNTMIALWHSPFTAKNVELASFCKRSRTGARKICFAPISSSAGCSTMLA